MFFLSVFLEIPFLGKFGPENQNCRFKVKFGIYFCKFEYPEFCVFTFSVLNPKYSFWVSLVPKKHNYLFKLKFVRLIGAYRIQWWQSLFQQKSPFFGKFGLQNQNNSLS